MYYFIINPKARTGLGAQIWRDVLAEIKRRRLVYEAFFTEHRGHAAKLARQICKKSRGDYLIVIGGDGTLQEILSGLSQPSTVTLGYIPAGSGNDFARSMNIPKNPMDALRLILDAPSPVSMDVGALTADNRQGAFGISCGMGFDAAICHAALSSRIKNLLNRIHLGKLTYAFLALRLLFSFRTFTLQLTLDGRKQTFDQVYFAAVMNQPYEGGGFLFCPDARPDDRLLDVIIVQRMSKLKLLLCLPTAFWGKHTHFKGVRILRGERILLESSRTVPLHQDGESAGIGKSLLATLRPEQISVITEETPAARLLPRS